MRSTFVIGALCAALALTGCARKPRAATTAPGAGPSTEAGADRPAADRDAEERARREADEARRSQEAARRDAALSEMIFFGFDSFDLDGRARSTLDGKATVLRADPSVRLRVEGHADEQGSTEYNLALGMRRAGAAREYLLGFGIEPRRITVTSHGEERPLEPGSGEEAHARNRRAEFVVLGPGAGSP
jgi:peptidoglycan-associated lipoprotein